MRRKRRSSSRCRARACRPARSVDLEHASKLVWYVEHVGFFDVNLWMADGEGGNRVKLDLPTDVEMLTHHGWMAIKPRKAWTVAGKTWPADTLLGIRLDAFMAGGRDFAVLFEPAGRRVLQGFFWSAGRLVLSILDNLQPVFEVLTPSDDGWARQGLTGLPAIGVVDMSPLDVEAVGKQRRPGRDRAGSADAAFPDAARRGQGARSCSSDRRRHSRRKAWW